MGSAGRSEPIGAVEPSVTGGANQGAARGANHRAYASHSGSPRMTAAWNSGDWKNESSRAAGRPPAATALATGSSSSNA